MTDESNKKQDASDRNSVSGADLLLDEKQTDGNFDFVDSDQDTPTRFSRWFWLQWIILLGVGFSLLSILSGDFSNLHEYGWSNTGVNWALLLTPMEKIFGLGLAVMLPIVIFLILAFEDIAAKPLIRFGRWLLHPRRIRFLLPILLLVTGTLITLTTLWVLDKQPLTDDENIYLFQSRIFASGRLALPSLADTEPLNDRLFEDNVFMVNNGKIFGQYPLGHSALLLPAYLLGWPQLATLISALLAVLGIFVLASRIYGRGFGLVAGLLMAISPMFLATSSTILSHTPVLCLVTWFYYFSYRTWKEDHWRPALLAGICFFLAFQIRSATALLAAGPTGIVLAVFLLRDYRRHWRKIALLATMVTLTLAVTFLLNYLINGSIFKTNYHAAWGEGRTPFQHPFGFGKGAWHIIHTPGQGLWNTVNNLLRLDWWLFGWPISLVFVVAWLWRRDKRAIEWIGLGTMLFTFATYFFYFWPGIADTGPVLYFELLAILILLTVSGMEATPRLLLRWMPREQGFHHMVLFVFFSCLIAFFSFHQYHARALMTVSNNVQELEHTVARYDLPENAIIFTNYYLKSTKDYSHQDSWVVGRPPTHSSLGDKRLFYVNYGRIKNQQFLEKHHPGLPAWVITWNVQGACEVVKLDEYGIDTLPDNYPDAR